MNFKSLFHTSTALVLTGALLCLALAAPIGAAQSTDALQQQISALDQKIAKNNEELARIRAEKNDQDAYIAKLNEQLAPLNEKVALVSRSVQELAGEIDGLNAQIDATQAQIDAQQAQIAGMKERLGARLRSMYMTGDVSLLEMLLGAADFSQYLTLLEMFNRTSANDKQLIRDLKEQIAALEENQKKLEDDKAALVEKQTQKQQELETLEAEQAKAQAAVDEVAAYVAQLDRNDARVVSLINRQEAEKDKAEATIQEILRNASHGSGEVAAPSDGSTKLAWPLPAYPLGKGYVSSPYGRRTSPYTGFHKGVDLSGGGVYGAGIAAAEAGTVISVYYEAGGYGNVFYIDHGNGVVTRYAHCSAVLVSVGQTVKRGETVGRVGSTGYSTGPHLHFEVRINGEHVNPMPYIT